MSPLTRWICMLRSDVLGGSYLISRTCLPFRGGRGEESSLRTLLSPDTVNLRPRVSLSVSNEIYHKKNTISLTSSTGIKLINFDTT